MKSRAQAAIERIAHGVDVHLVADDPIYDAIGDRCEFTAHVRDLGITSSELLALQRAFDTLHVETKTGGRWLTLRICRALVPITWEPE